METKRKTAYQVWKYATIGALILNAFGWSIVVLINPDHSKSKFLAGLDRFNTKKMEWYATPSCLWRAAIYRQSLVKKRT